MRATATVRGRFPGIAAVATLVGMAAGCALFYENPTVRIAGVRVTGVGLTGATAEIGLEVDNPNGFSLTTTGVSYRLAFQDGEVEPDRESGWRTIAEGESEEVVTVPGEETSRVTLSVPFRYEDVGRAVESFLQRGELRYRLTGALRVDGPVGGVRVPFDETGDVGA